MKYRLLKKLRKKACKNVYIEFDDKDIYPFKIISKDLEFYISYHHSYIHPIVAQRKCKEFIRKYILKELNRYESKTNIVIK